MQLSENDVCLGLHAFCCSLPRCDVADIARIDCKNGIYILFEKGEVYHSFDRIVRVGTHRRQGRLKRRLADHFLSENKDRSIFRKNIGKTMLNENGDPYLQVWSMGRCGKDDSRFNAEFQKELEMQITAYLRENITISCVRVETMQERLRYEEGIISTLHRADDFVPGSKWLGRFSPEPEIRSSGMWLKQGLNGTPLTAEEMDLLLNGKL